MNWSDWYKDYESFPSLQARLQLVQAQIVATLNECPPGEIKITSLCAGDGRDVIGALQNHPRRNDVSARLLDDDLESINRGREMAEQAGLGEQLRFVHDDATRAKNYLGAVPADLVLLSGFLGHLRHEDVPRLIKSLPMLCKKNGWAIWNRHLLIHQGREQVSAIRDFFRQTKFAEVFYETTGVGGFAVGRVRFAGEVEPLDAARVFFEFAGLDRLRPKPPATETNLTNGAKMAEGSGDAGQSIPTRFEEIAALHPARTAVGSGEWQPAYEALNVAANRLAHVLIPRGEPGDRVAVLMRHDAPLIAAILAILKAGRILVVLNPTDPPARLKQILDEAEARVLVTDLANHALAAQVAGKNQDVVGFEKDSTGPARNPEIKIVPDAVAAILFTSGSTGRPKGVMQTHRNIIHNVSRLTRGMRLQKEDRLTLLASPSGGQGLSTTWCALLNGAALCPFPLMEKSVAGLADWVVAQDITVFVSTASLFRHFTQSLDDKKTFPTVRLVRLGSEPATADDFKSYQRHFAKDCVLLNSLSSTETGNITQHRLTQNESFAEGRLPVGWPVEGMEILLLDENGREVGEGETGEMVVRSRYLSPGYWRNEPLTARCFSEANGADGLRIFRSGDLGRRTADGALRFLDRKDARVKIHGYRVEVSEIESALERQPEVASAAVCAQTLPNGDTRLVAYVVPAAAADCTAEILRRSLLQIIPSYMVPASFVFLDELPLTPHGKLDRGQLGQIPSPVPTPPPVEVPATNTEILLADIWKKVFDRGTIGRHDDFFDLGGDSLNASVVAAQVHAALGVELELRVFAEHSTLAELARAVDDLRRADRTRNTPGLVRVSRTAPLPLSFSQERVWKQSQSVAGSLGYTMASSHHIRGPLNVSVLRASMSFLIRRHEILRTTFEDVAGRLVQIIHPPGDVSLAVLDFAGDPEAEARTARLFWEEGRRRFDLQQPPLMRFTLVRIGENDHRLLRVNHHILSDAWSWKIYFRELGLAYEAGLRGETPPLPEFKPLQYADYAARQRRPLNVADPAWREDVDWWSRRFTGRLRPTKLPFTRFWRSRRARPDDGVLTWGLAPAVSDRLARLGRAESATYFELRLAAFIALLAAKNHQPDIILSTFLNYRNCVATQDMFGDFVNPVTLRLQCDQTRTFREWLAVTRKLLGETQARSEISYEQLCVELQQRGVHLPETPIIFSVSDHTAPVRFGGLEIEWLDRHTSGMPWGFQLNFNQHHEEHCCLVSFNAYVYHPARVQAWISWLVRFLDAASQNPDLPLGHLLAMTSLRA